MLKTVSTCLGSIAIILLVCVSCKLVRDDGNASQGVNALRLGSVDVSPWREEPNDGFLVFKASNMFDLINGGAQMYVNKGMIAGFQQDMSISGEKSARFLVLDYATEDKAIEMYNYSDASNGDKLNAGNEFPLSVAQLDGSPLGGVIAIAHFGKFYMELTFTGFSDKSEAVKTAVSFIEVFEQKIDAL